jgi:hypothetical protein
MKVRGKNKMLPKSDWVWSAEQAHEALVTKELFDKVEERSERRTNRIKAGRTADNAQRTGTRPGRFYAMRGRVFCDICGGRLEGSFQKSNCYRCTYARGHGAAAAEASGHPRSLQISENVLRAELRTFFLTRIFGPDRIDLLREDLKLAAGPSPLEAHKGKKKKLEQQRAGVETSISNQTRRLAKYDPDHPLAPELERSVEELLATRADLDAQLRELATVVPARDDPAEIEAVLAAIPDLSDAYDSYSPEELAELLAAFDVKIYFNSVQRTLRIDAGLAAESAARSAATGTVRLQKSQRC